MKEKGFHKILFPTIFLDFLVQILEILIDQSMLQGVNEVKIKCTYKENDKNKCFEERFNYKKQK